MPTTRTDTHPTPRPSRILFTALALAALLIAPLAADVQETFQVADGGTLEVDSKIGSIQVEPQGSGEVRIEIEISGSNQDEVSFDLSQRGDTILVKGDYSGSSSWFGWGDRRPKVKIRAWVPERFDLDLDTSGGAIAVGDLEGSVKADTSGGSLRFGNIEGPVLGDTSGGSIVLEGARGDVSLDTSGGSITVGDVDGSVNADTSGGSITIGQVRDAIRADTSGGSIRIESSGGSVVAETSGGSISIGEAHGAIDAETSGGGIEATIRAQPSDDSRLITSGGPIRLRLADGIGVDIDAQSSGGRVSSELELADRDQSRTRLTGKAGGGGPRVTLRSSGGGVSISGD